jgi:hypothetical protein
MMEGWLEVWRGSLFNEAQFLKSVLEGSGIEAQIPDEHMHGAQPHLSIAIGGVRLLVQEKDAQKAREVFKSFSRSPLSS